MKKLTWGKGFLCCLTIALLAGCQTVPSANGLSVGPVAPQDNEVIVRDQLIIIVDETGSIGSSRIYEYEKDIAQAFTGAMPDGMYLSGIDSFAGVKSILWLKKPLAPFSRERMVSGADSLEPLGSLTPLARAIRSQEKELAANPGRAALLILSDGMVRIPEDVIQACRDMDAIHNGELCIYTVQVGHSDRGRQLLQEMAAVNGCGKYYDSYSAFSIDTLVRDIFFGTREVQVASPGPQNITWTINNILFDNDESVILPKYNSIIDEAAAILKNNMHTRIHIHLEGHTDFNASDEYNQKLSERRVNAVFKAIVQRGADPARLDTKAYGEVRPEVPNDSPEHLHMNRRVELTVVE